MSGMTASWVSGLIFLITFLAIMTDVVHRTIAAWVGAAVMVGAGLLIGFYTHGQALQSIDFNTLALLLGMMILMAMLSKTGVFEYLALLAAQQAHGSPWRLLVLLGTLTAVISMFLNNMTVIILIAPVTLLVAGKLRMNPIPLLIAEAVLSNVGGTATLIGDPPNTLIASAARFSFNDFLIILLPIVVVAFYPTLLTFRHAFPKPARSADAGAYVASLPETETIKDPILLRKLLIVLFFILLLFVLQDMMPLLPGYVAFAGAGMALLWLKPDPEEVLKEVEWSALLFFASLFIVVGGLEAAGVMKAVASVVLSFAGSHVLLSAVLLIWIAAILSAVVDNIPFVIAMIPIIKSLDTEGLTVEPLWWALALGAGFGGSGTPIGASANIMAISFSERAGHPISFRLWVRSGLLATLVSCGVGTLAFLVVFGIIKH